MSTFAYVILYGALASQTSGRTARFEQIVQARRTLDDGADRVIDVSFGGEVLPIAALLEGPESEAWANLDIPAFSKKNSKEIREPEIFACAAALRSQRGFKKVGTVGYW